MSRAAVPSGYCERIANAYGARANRCTWCFSGLFYTWMTGIHHVD